MMQFEIPFNEALFRKQSKFYFDFFWKKNLNKNERKLYLGIPLILLGSLIRYGKSDLGYFYILIGIYCMLSFYLYWRNYNKNKKKYFELLESNIKRDLEGNTIVKWNFNDEFFEYSDNDFDLKIKWEMFESYQLIHRIVFINLRNKIAATLLLSEEEIGKENFDKVIELIKEKISNKNGI